MPHPTAILDVVGLSTSLIGAATPNLKAFADRGRLRRMRPGLPALTCSVQAGMLTGTSPRDHGIVGNGWYDRDLAEVHFWKQSDHLVGGEKVWETARQRDPSVTCAKLFWWYNMYSSVEYSVTPRPIYKADGRKIPDCHTHPAGLRTTLQEKLGPFPLFQFWGPGTSIASSRWIAEAAKLVYERHRPTLNLVYLPHLDYGLQKLGPDHPDIDQELKRVDEVAGDLIDFFEERGVRVVVLSEYGVEPVDDAVHVNRVFRERGLLSIRQEQGLEQLDAGASDAFAVADHQVAHVYVRDEWKIPEVADLCAGIGGVERVLNRDEKAEAGLDHRRAGDLVLVAEPRRWFSYYYWLDDRRAPDYARTVDIHRKPGYDPVELFLDPALAMPRLRIARTLLAKKLGFRALLDVIPLDASLVRGSHGRADQPPELQPVLLTRHPDGNGPDVLPVQAVRDVILEQLFAD